MLPENGLCRSWLPNVDEIGLAALEAVLNSSRPEAAILSVSICCRIGKVW